MEELTKLIPPDVGWKVAGWSFTAAVTMGTMLYKGIWKRINQLAEDLDDTRTDLDRLIGACGVNHQKQTPWVGAERRKAKRETEDE